MSTRRLYQAAPGAGFNDEQAQKYGTFLTGKVGLGKRAVAPAEIVRAATPADSPIHGEFEWDDSVAAHEHRLEQARHLVSHIITPKVAPSGATVTSRAYHNVTEKTKKGSQRGYVSSEVVWSKPELAEQVREKALADLRGWTQRYKDYSILADVVPRVEEILDDEAGHGEEEAA